jgi:hypothetical protein
MKKIIALLALALVVAFATGSYAEVQNVKVGGDIRIRATYEAHEDDLTNHEGDSLGFINQRTRVITEADLTDNVAVNATIEANGLWGQDDVVDTVNWFDQRKEWVAGFSEAWVQLSELYYTPLTVKIGRQYLNYGRGFIVSSNEYELNFDAVKAVLNFEPWTIDGVYAKLVETSDPTPLFRDAGYDIDLWGGNVHYAADTWNIEGYVWGVANKDVPSDLAAKPLVFGIRGDVTPVENLDLWGELSYETGDISDPYTLESMLLTALGLDAKQDISAFGTDLGGKYTFANVAWKPTIGIEWAWAQGDEDDASYQPLFQYNYWGYCFSPRFSNIHIINANLTVEPIEKLALILDYYHYLQDKAISQIVGNPAIDNGGVMALTNGSEKTLGNELDLIAEYDYTEDVSTQLYLAWFWPGDAYSDTTGKEDAYEVRGEIIVSF